MTGHTFSSTARVGILVVVTAVLLYAGIIFLGGRFTRHGAKYFVDMPDAGGMVKGTRISMAGVRIGEVEDVQLVNPRQVQVTIIIEEKYKIPRGSVAEIPVQLISLGESGMVIVPPKILDGDLAVGSIIEGSHPGTLEALLPGSKEAMQNVNDILKATRDLVKDEGLKGSIKSLLASSARTMKQFEQLAGSTNTLLNENKGSISKAVSDAEAAMADVRKGADLVYRMVHDGHYQDQATSLLKHLDETSAKAGKLIDSLDAYVNNPDTHDTLKATMNNVRDISEQGKLMATKMNTIVDNGTIVSGKAIELTNQATEVAAEAKTLEKKIEALVDKVEGKVDAVKLPKNPIGPIHAEVREIRDTWPNYNRTDVNFTIPVAGQNLYLGLFDAFASNKLNAQLGQKLGSNAVLRYGAYAGTEGLGVDYRIAPRLGLKTDVFNANKPRFDALVHYDFGKGFETWIGMDRIFDRNGFAFGIGFQK